MTNQYWLSQLMGVKELLHVGGHCSVVMSRVVGGVTMVSEVLCCIQIFQCSELVFRQNITNQGVHRFVEIPCKYSIYLMSIVITLVLGCDHPLIDTSKIAFRSKQTMQEN